MNIKVLGFLLIIFLFSSSCDKDDYSSADITEEIEDGNLDKSLLGEWETVSSYYIMKQGDEILEEGTEDFVEPTERTIFVLKSGNVGSIKDWDEESAEWKEYPLRYSARNKIIEFTFDFQDEDDELLIALLLENFPFVYAIKDNVLKLEFEFTDEEGVYQKQILVLNRKADS